MGTLLVFAAMYSVLFALLATFKAPPVVFITVSVFLTGVGLSQMFLFGGNAPRKASVVGGTVMLYVLTSAGMLIEFIRAPHRLDAEEVGAMVLAPVCGAVTWGPALGYLAGVLTASVFLVLQYDRRAMERDAEETAQPQSPFAADEP